ncbi:hypothetical protein, partial [Reichenbachiella sp. MALMAid0571]|uniref:hypothetical protein n=1 Tax=Reichenbachiella sp. MALMAid0571 TaxID=3143939 RepID=UPI0032DF35EF
MPIIRLFFVVLLLQLTYASFSQKRDTTEMFYLVEGALLNGVDTVRSVINRHVHTGDTLFEICYDRFSYSYQRSRSVCYSFSTKSPVNEVKYVSSRDF